MFKTVAYLLKDAVQSYQLSKNGTTNSQIDYENALGLTNTAEEKYQAIAATSEKNEHKTEIISVFSELKSSLLQKAAPDSISRLASTIEQDLAEDLLSN